MLCTEWCLVNSHGDVATAITLYCNSWGCEHCAPRRKRRLIRDAKRGKPNTFITLTVNPAVGDGPDDRAATLAGAWRKIRRRAMKRYGYARLPFLAVFETTKRGEPHLHILARVKWLDQRWLSAQMLELMGAPIVDIRRVQSARQVANYVAKYIGKDPHHFATTKRYWSSQDWSKWRPDYPYEDDGFGSGWTVVKMTPAKWAQMMEGYGWVATLARGGYQVSRIRDMGG